MRAWIVSMFVLLSFFIQPLLPCLSARCEPQEEIVGAPETKFHDRVMEQNNLGFRYYWQGKYQDAARCFDEALRLAPKSAPLYSNRALVLARIGRFTEALKSHRQAIELSPKSSSHYAKRGYTYLDVLDAKNALEDFSKWVELAPYDPWGYVNKARAENLLGNRRAAAQDLATASELLTGQVAGEDKVGGTQTHEGLEWSRLTNY